MKNLAYEVEAENEEEAEEKVLTGQWDEVMTDETNSREVAEVYLSDGQS